MAGPIPASKTIRVAVQIANTDGRVAQSAFYLQYSGSAPTGADLTALAGAAVGSVNANLMPLIHSDWTSSLVICTDLTSELSATGEVSSPSPGLLAGAPLPASTALVVSNTVAVRYRGGHFRQYLPVGDATKLSGDTEWQTVFLNDVVTAWAQVISDTSAAVWGGGGILSQVAPSFYDGFTNESYGSPPKYRRVPTPRASAVIYPVVTLLGRLAIGTQRRRLRTAG